MDAIISEEYEQQYFDECKYIWKNYVPQAGQADNLQGELLREIEKIRCEAQDNGNINWDDDYSYFCDFISRKLTEQPVISVVFPLASFNSNINVYKFGYSALHFFTSGIRCSSNVI